MGLLNKSGYFSPNKFGLILLLAFEEILGKEATNGVLTEGGLAYLIDNYPKDNLKKEFDFSDISALALSLEKKYGLRGGRGLCQRIGKAASPNILKHFGALAGTELNNGLSLPLQSKIKRSLVSVAKLFSEMGDELITLDENESAYFYTVHRCPNCWGRTQEERPVCYLQLGFLQETLRLTSGSKELRIYESKCIAMGDQVCEFTIKKIPLTQ